MKGKKTLRKIVAVLYTLFVLCQSATAQDAGMAGMFIHPAFVDLRENISVKDVIVPTDLGYIDSFYQGNSKETVFIIKDAHCNYGAQKTIISLIDWFVSRYGISLVNLEGGSGKYDLSIFEDINDRHVRQWISEKYLKEGKLNAAEVYKIFNPEQVVLSGMEDPYLYQRNLDAYHLVLEYKDRVDAFIDNLKRHLAEDKEKYLSGTVEEYVRINRLYDTHEADMSEYVTYLTETALAHSLDRSLFPNLMSMREIILNEKEIDFAQADSQREDLARTIMDKLSLIERRELAGKVTMVKNKQMSQHTLYSFIADKADEFNLRGQRYEEIFKYIEYSGIHDELDKTLIFRELGSVRRELAKKLATTEKEARIIDLSGQISLLEKMFTLKMDRDALSRARRTVDVDALLEYLEGKIPDEQFNEVLEDAAHLMRGIMHMTVFYFMADKRDRAFLSNIKRNMARRKVSSSMVLMGGFHYENLAGLLREEGISYVSIIPSFTNAPGYVSPYMELIGGEIAGKSADMFEAIASASIQPRSIWSDMGIDTDFVRTLLERMQAVLDVEERKGTQEVLFEISDRKVFFYREDSEDESGYRPTLLYPSDYKTREKCKVVRGSSIMDIPEQEFRKKVEKFFTSEARETFLRMMQRSRRFSSSAEIAEVLKSKALRRTIGGGIAPKKALLRPNGHVVEREVRGMKDIDTYVYIYDVSTSKLICQSSEAKIGADSGYMLKPAVEGTDDKPLDERNEKWYLCKKLTEIFAPGNTVEDQKNILQSLLDEQHYYESRLDDYGDHSCGWEWDIDHDENGKLYVDPENFLGLRALRIYDRQKLPKGVYPRKMDRDAILYGGIENVQEMQFSIVRLTETKVRIELITSWPAEERGNVLEREANKDDVSGLANKRFFRTVVFPELIAQEKEALPLAVLFIDGDNFKHYNDDYNHTVGDEIIRAMADSIKKSVRGSDVVFNWGGDEFLVLLPGTLATNAKVVANNISEQIKRISSEDVFMKAGYDTDKPVDEKFSATIGVAMASSLEQVKDLERVIDSADDMLKIAKRTRKGTVMVLGEYDDLEEFDSRGGFGEVQDDRIPIDLRLLLKEYYPALLYNLETFISRDYLKGMPQGEAIRAVYNDIKEDRFLQAILNDLTEYQGRIEEYIAGETSPPVELIEDIKTSVRAFYSRIYAYKVNMNNAVGDRAASRNVSAALANIGDIDYLLSRYVMREWEKISEDPSDERTWEDSKGNSVTLPSFGSVLVSDKDVPREDKIFTGEYSSIEELVITVLMAVRGLFLSEFSGRGEERILENNVFSRYAGSLIDSYEKGNALSREHGTAVAKGIEEFSKWISKLALEMSRFPGEERVVVYPVYNKSIYSRDMSISLALRRRMLKKDYKEKMLPIPYLAGDDSSVKRAISAMEDIVDGNREARAVLFAEGDVYDENSARLRGLFDDRVICLKEEGYDSGMDRFSHIGIGIRTAFSMAVIDYFMPEEKNGMKEDARYKLKDMIAAMLGVMTGDRALMERFSEQPADLLNGLLTIRPAEKISWEEIQAKMEHEKEFMHSL